MIFFFFFFFKNWCCSYVYWARLTAEVCGFASTFCIPLERPACLKKNSNSPNSQVAGLKLRLLINNDNNRQVEVSFCRFLVSHGLFANFCFDFKSLSLHWERKTDPLCERSSVVPAPPLLPSSGLAFLFGHLCLCCGRRYFDKRSAEGGTNGR